ncbi:MAG: YraN family protein [Gemmatimonadota bacterium]
MPIDPADWTDARHRMGLEAEEAAGRWLVERGWRVEAHRWTMGRHDLDLIARRAGIVAFIEVKLRRSNTCGTGVEAVGRRKRYIIERTAWSWILLHGRSGDRYRFDVMTLARPDGLGKVEHLEDAWRPGWR